MAVDCCEVEASTPRVHDAAATDFREGLLNRLACGRLGWVDLATIAWKATKAGDVGIKGLAVDPRSKGANQASRFRKALGLEALDARLYKVQIPMWGWSAAERCMGQLVMRLPPRGHRSALPRPSAALRPSAV